MREGGSHVRAAVGDRDDDARVTPARAVRSRSDETHGDGARSGHEIRSDEAMSSGDGRGREPTAVTVTATASRTGVSDAHAPPAVVWVPVSPDSGGSEGAGVASDKAGWSAGRVND